MTDRQQWAAFRANLPTAPRSLVVLGAVSLVATLVYVPTMFLPDEVHERLLPHLGWSPILLLGGPAILSGSIVAYRQLKTVRGLVFLGWVCALCAVRHAYLLGNGSTNPFHSASPWLVAWELALATVLFVVGTSPRVHAYCRGAP